MTDRVNQSRPWCRPGARSAALAGTVALALVLGGCEQQIDVRGNLPSPNIVSSIKPGVHKREDIRKLLGTPSTVATFEKETWYYIGGRVKTVSFFDPELLERRVLTIRFDKQGIVRKVEQIDASKSRNIELVERETPTKGKELTFLQQIIGNIGRFGGASSSDTDIFTGR